MNYQDIAEVSMLMHEIWPQHELPGSTEAWRFRERAWQAVLGDLDSETLIAAVTSLGEREFPPPLGMVRERALALCARRDGIEDPPPIYEAIEYMLGVACVLDRGQTPDWVHPAVIAAVRHVGTNQVRFSTRPELVQRDFERIYPAIAERYRRESHRPAPAVAGWLGLYAPDVYGEIETPREPSESEMLLPEERVNIERYERTGELP